MYNIDFYETSSGHSDVFEFLENLRISAHSSKDARIQYKQVARYIQLPEDNGTYILLHHFRKQTQKTPRREINQAISEMNAYISRK